MSTMKTTSALQAAATSSTPWPKMSPHDPSLVSLINSFFEPNFLILVTYLFINLWLAYRVIRIATKKYGQLKLTPPESGELATIEMPAENQEDVLELHSDLFRTVTNFERSRKSKASDTPVADTLIKLATWAFRSEARNAKRIVAVLAVISLASTWYYMISFLRHSYEAYLERCHLTSYPLPPAPPPFDLGRPDLLVPALHLRIVRISQWLASLSLFKEAWMEVIKDAPSWWWSSEICIITVGAWALFLRHEAERVRIPHVWTAMALGQLVAISFAFNLFNLAVIYRLDAKDLLEKRCEKVKKPKRRVIEPIWASEPESEDEDESDSSFNRDDDSRPYRVAMAEPVRPDRSPPHSPDTSLPPTPRRSPDPNTVLLSTDVIVQKKPLPPRPTIMDKIGLTMQRWIPDKVGLPLFVLAGLSSVLQHPNSFPKVMVMHLFPLLISLYPSKDQLGTDIGRRADLRSRFGDPDYEPEPLWLNSTPEMTTKQILLRMFHRSDSRLRLVRDPKMYYLGLGAVSMVLRLWLTIVCFIQVKTEGTVLHRVWQTLTLLFPTTFLRHPAQSSISSDHACVALSATAFVLVESGLWLWKAANASPSTGLPPEIILNCYRRMPRKPSETTVMLDDADRKVIETQARVIVALLLLSPVLGGSATFSLYLAMRCTWVQQDNRKRELDNWDWSRDRDRPGSIMEEREEVKLIENDEGERYLELRKIKVRLLRPRRGNAAQAPNPPPAPPANPERAESLPPSRESSIEHRSDVGSSQEGSQAARRRGRRSRSGTSEAEIFGVSSSMEGQGRRTTPKAETGVSSSMESQGRRTTPTRQRHPPQRYGESSPAPLTSTSPRR